ncbi:hypothetical protein BSKO_09347 [Bryopsis sp. KO-2023]|nr:hypothetical protein BSKO_09347 [Bryopsis sp. KO-2023]
MAMTLTRAFGRMALASKARVPSAATCSFKANVGAAQVFGARPIRTTPVFSATVEAKQNTLKRQRTAEKARVRNKSRKSAVKTRMKKALTAMEAMKDELPKSVEDLKPVELLISEAYKEIDKAVSKGTLHKSTGSRRKSRLGVAKSRLAIEAGLYVPS